MRDAGFTQIVTDETAVPSPEGSTEVNLYVLFDAEADTYTLKGCLKDGTKVTITKGA